MHFYSLYLLFHQAAYVITTRINMLLRNWKRIGEFVCYSSLSFSLLFTPKYCQPIEYREDTHTHTQGYQPVIVSPFPEQIPQLAGIDWYRFIMFPSQCTCVCHNSRSLVCRHCGRDATRFPWFAVYHIKSGFGEKRCVEHCPLWLESKMADSCGSRIRYRGSRSCLNQGDKFEA